jgi:hypothetical protein
MDHSRSAEYLRKTSQVRLLTPLCIAGSQKSTDLLGDQNLAAQERKKAEEIEKAPVARNNVSEQRIPSHYRQINALRLGLVIGDGRQGC